MSDDIERLQQENHLLHAKVASLQAKAGRDAQVHLLLNRIAELSAKVKRLNDDWESAILRGKDLVRQVIDVEAERDALRKEVRGAVVLRRYDTDPQDVIKRVLRALDGGDDA